MSNEWHSKDMLDKGVIHIPGWTEWAGVRFDHATQNDGTFETYELLLSGIFRLIFLDSGWQQVIETTERKSMDQEGLLY